jgi:hypothetical protein
VSVPSNLRSDDDFEDFYQANYPAYDAPEAWVRRVALNLATTGLRRPPLRHRQVLVLHYGADLPVEQVAQQLRLPTGTGEEPAGPSPRRARRLPE